MFEECPRCGFAVPADLTACPRCGLARSEPAFAADGTFLGSRFSVSPENTTAGSETTANRALPGKPKRFIPVVAAVMAAAVILGVVVALAIRPETQIAGGPGTTSPTPAVPDASQTPAPTVTSAPDSVFDPVLHQVGTGTHRVVATTCTGSGIGTAYAMGGDTLVASARSVAGAQSVGVIVGTRVVPAEVVKVDGEAGLAILRPSAAVGGHVFTLGTHQLAHGDQVGLVGWSTQAPQPSVGQLTGLTEEVTETGVRVPSPDGELVVRRVSGSFDPGLAGAPVVDPAGLVVGMVVQGAPDQKEMLVAGLDSIADAILGPTGSPPPEEPCPSSSGPDVATVVSGSAPAAARTVLNEWFTALNAGDWQAAHDLLGPRAGEEFTAERLAQVNAGSFHFALYAVPGAPEKVTLTWATLGSAAGCQLAKGEFVVDGDLITAIEPGPSSPCA